MIRRRTRQLDAVRQVVYAACDHPSADQVFARVRQMLPDVSLGTIYRNLDKLAADGEIDALQVGTRSTRFDGVTEPHDHFYCEACGAVTDLLSKRPRRSGRDALLAAGYGVRVQMMTFFGRCPACNE